MRAVLGIVAAVAVMLSVQTAGATPEGDAHDAITAAWRAAGGDTSPLGAPLGDVYPAGAGFEQNFAGGKMFFTPDTGAKALYGAILEKYESLGGAANGDLGFPNIDEVPGLSSPDSRVVTFAAPDNPVIFWTPEHGAHSVRGPINVGWDKLGSSTGALGVPVEDESYDGSVVAQKFSAGQLSFDNATKTFTTVPPDLADQLADLQVQIDPAVAIGEAWRAAGGASGSLGAKQGDQYPVGNDGVGQDFAGGKAYFSPATGSGVVAGDILAKYESLGGPAGSDLGFPVGGEADGSISGSRFSTFSADDQPVVFFSPGNGAFVVRSAMKVAWDKLDGASGKLGAPVGDQTVEGDVVSQKFTGGTISWNRVTNTFSTEPGDLAKSLSGLQIPGLNLPNASSSTSVGGSSTESHWHWSWVLIPVAVLAVLGVLAAAALWWQRRRSDVVSLGGSTPVARVGNKPAEKFDGEDQWSGTNRGPDPAVRLPSRYGTPGGLGPGRDPAGQSTPDDAWTRFGETPIETDESDTAPTRVVTEEDFGTGRHAVVSHPDTGGDAHTFQAFQAFQAQEDTSVHPVMHLPLDDPYQPPEGYPIKANIGSGLYYTTASPLYGDTLAEIWFTTEDAARLNGFTKAG